MAKSTKRADGRLVKSIVDPRTGKRKFFYGYSEREINQKLLKYTSEIEIGRLFRDVASDWWDASVDRFALQSIKAYRPAYHRAVERFGDTPIRDIKPRDISLFFMVLAKKGLAFKTISNQRTVINQIFDHAVLENDIDLNPCASVSLPKDLPRSKRTAASLEDENIIRNGDDVWLFHYIAIMTGMRKGEILALQWGDVDFDRNIIHVTKSVGHEGDRPVINPPKTKSGIRVVPLLPDLKERFLRIPNRKKKDYIISDDGKTPLTNSRYETLSKHAAERTGISCTAHQLRHSFATYAFEKGVPGKSVQEILGHKQLSTTMDMYTDFRAESLKITAEILSSDSKKKK